MPESPEELVRRRARIRIYSGAVGHSDHVMAEGEVIGYCDRPTLLIADDTGRQSSWSVDLPREDVPPGPAGQASDGRSSAMNKPKLATWEGHGKPQWFYLYEGPSDESPGDDIVSVTLHHYTEHGTELLLKSRDGYSQTMLASREFYAFVHCCPGEESHGDPHGLHTFDCPVYEQQATAMLAAQAQFVEKQRQPARLPFDGDNPEQQLRMVAEQARVLALQARQRGSRRMMLRPGDVLALADAVLSSIPKES